MKLSLVLLVGYLLLLLSPYGDAAAALTNVSFWLFPGLAALACWKGSRRLPRDQRRTWQLVTVALGVYAGGGLAWTAYAVSGAPVPVPSWGEVGFLGYVLPLTAALLALPIVRAGRLARLEVVADCAVLFSSVLFCVWVLVIRPLQASAAGGSPLEVAVLYAYPAVDVLVIAAALATLMRVRSRDLTSWLALFAGLVTVALGDLHYVSLVARDAYDPAAAYNVSWAFAFALIGAAPHLGGLSQPAGHRLSVARALVPYIALAAAVATGLSVAIHPRRDTAVFVLAVVLFVAAAARQVLVVIVKTRLADDLEGQVASATSELRAEREFLSAIVDSLHAGVVACDRDGTVTLVNDATAQFHSDPTRARLGLWSTDLRTADGTSTLPPSQTPLLRVLRGERVEDLEFMIMPPDAPALALTASGRALRDPNGGVVGAVVAIHDVTERRRHQAALERRAAQDELTGLGNRGAFSAAITRQLTQGSPVAVLLLDLDDFKHINDSLGHDAGDRCLVEIAQRLTRTLRDQGTAYRLGGDEFVIILHRGGVAPEDCAQQVLEAIGQAFYISGTELRTTASIGLAVSGPHSSSAQELLQAADLAMYVAKSGGKSRVSSYQDHMRAEAQNRLALQADLRQAISEGGLHLQYQPIVELSSGRMSAAEALVRWNHPVRGPMSPVDFIPVAEQCGLIAPLGEWVLCEAAAQLLAWDALGGDDTFRVTVNISTRQLERPGLLEVLDRCLGAGVHPSRLVLEVTETALTLDSAAAIETMHAIRARGVQLAVDDFGTGYSSLSRLRSAPVSRIKIDRSFIDEITDAEADVPLVEATMAMARGLGMGVIAEGVETPEQLAYLARVGCPEVQGYLLSRPVAPDGILACMTTSPWSELLQQSAPDQAALHLASDSSFLRLVELAVDPHVGLEELVRTLLADLHQTTGLAMTYMTRVREDSDRQEVRFVQSVTPGPVHEGLVVPWSESLCKRALEHGPRRSSDPDRDYNGQAAALGLGLASYVVEPVNGPDGHLYGTLCGASTQSRDFNDNDSASLRMYARLIEQKLDGDTADAVVGARRASASLALQRQQAEHTWEDISDRLLRAAGSPAEVEHRAQHIQAADRAWSAQRRLLALRDDDGDLRQRIVIADDQRLLRDVMAAVLAGEDNLRLVGSADSAWATVGVVAAEQPDVLVLDHDLGDADASEVIEHIRTLSPGTRVLLHSARPDVHVLGQQMRVDRVVHKADEAGRLLEAVRVLAT